MDPLTLSLIMAGVQGGVGLWQSLQPEPEEAKYEIPFSERLSNLLAGQEVSRSKYATQLPGQEIAEANIKQSTANALQSIKESAGTQAQALEAASGLAVKEQEAFRDLGFQQAQYSQQKEEQARRDYIQSLGRLGQYEEQQQYYNEIMPKERAYADWVNKRQAGMGNIMGALNLGLGAYTQNYYNKQMGGWMNGSSGNTGTSNTTTPFNEMGYNIGDSTPFGTYVSNNMNTPQQSPINIPMMDNVDYMGSSFKGNPYLNSGMGMNWNPSLVNPYNY